MMATFFLFAGGVEAMRERLMGMVRVSPCRFAWCVMSATVYFVNAVWVSRCVL